MSEFPSLDGFKFQRLLGRGGMATVYLATQESLHRDVAIKVMSYSNDQEFLQRFLNEGRLIASINHPNVITVFDVGQLDDGRSFIAMEYVEGGDLEQRLKNEEVPLKDALLMIRQAAECLQVVHEKGIIHRDIKPANFLFRTRDTLVVTDFGVAKQLEELDVKLTQDGHTMGSPAYTSPEQAQCKVVDGRTDIYSLGVVLAEILMGENPYLADTYLDTTLRHVSGDLPVLPDEYSIAQPLLDKMLAKQPEDRQANMAELIDEIDQCLIMVDSGQSAVAVSTIKNSALATATKSKKTIIAVVVSVVLFLLFSIMYQANSKYSPIFNQAEDLIEQGELIAPAEPNAEALYRSVLAEDISNRAAKKGLLSVADALIDKALLRVDELKITQPNKDNALYFFSEAQRLGLAEAEQQDFKDEAVERLVKQATLARNNKQFFKPSDPAAWVYYRAALAIDKSNPDLAEEIDEFLKEVALEARDLFKQEQYEEALELVKRGMRVNSEHLELKSAENDLRDMYNKLPRSKRKGGHLKALDKIRNIFTGDK